MRQGARCDRAARGDAWAAYSGGRKALVTRAAGPGFADPEYQLSVEWSDTRLRLQRAESRQKDPQTQSRVLVICVSARNDGTCAGEISKTFRFATTGLKKPRPK